MKRYRRRIWPIFLLCLLALCFPALMALGEGSAHTVRCQFTSEIPARAASHELPAAMEIAAGVSVALPRADYVAPGYDWSGWRVTSQGRTLPVTEGAFTMPDADVLVSGGWTVRTVELSLNTIDGWYTGERVQLVLGGMVEGDRAYLRIGNGQETAMSGGKAGFVNATAGRLSVYVRVERDRATVRTLASTVNIRPRMLTFQIGSYSGVYDGREHAVSVEEITPQDAQNGYGYAKNEENGVSVNVGTSARQTYCTGGVIAVGANSAAPCVYAPGLIAGNYAVTVLPGSVEITKRPVTLVAPSAVFDYDASVRRLSAAGVVEKKGEGFLNDVASFSVAFSGRSSERRLPGTQAVTLDLATLALTPARGATFPAGVSLAEQYAVRAQSGALTVEARARTFPVTLKATPVEYVYTGERQRIDPLGYTVKGLPEGVAMSGVRADTVGTDAGAHEISFAGTPRFTDGGVDVSACFAVSEEGAVMTILPAEATLRVQSEAFEYDGQPHHVTAVAEGLAGAHTASVALENAVRVDVGANDVTVLVDQCAIVDRQGRDLRHNYRLTAVDGVITVNAGELPYGVLTYLEQPDGSFVRANSEQRVGAGQSAIDMTALQMPVEGYAFVRAEPEAAAVEPGTVIRLYYRRQYAVRYRFSDGFMPRGFAPPADQPDVPAGEPVTADAGAYALPGYLWSGWQVAEPSGLTLDEGGGFVMPRTDVTLVGGWSADTAALAAKGISEYYTGSPYQVAVLGMTEGDQAYLRKENELIPLAQAAFTHATDGVQRVEVVVRRDEREIWSSAVCVEIRPRTLMYAVRSDTFVYDGQPHTLALVDNTPHSEGYGPAPGEVVALTLGGKATQTYVTPPVAIDSSDVSIAYENGASAENYRVLLAYGSIEITKRPVRMIAPGGEFVYDARTHALNPMDARVETADGLGFLPGVTYAVAFAANGGERRVPGVQPVALNPATLVLSADGIPVNEQYAVTFESAALRVAVPQEPIPVTLAAADVERVYDGETHTVYASDASAYQAAGLPEGVVLTGVGVRASGKDAGEYEIAFTGTPTLTDGGVEVNECFAVQWVGAKLRIARAEVTLTVENAEFAYDGFAHSANWRASGIAQSDEIVPALNGNRRTEVGANAVTIDRQGIRFVSADDQQADVTANYLVMDCTDGSIEITPVMTPYTVRCLLEAGEGKELAPDGEWTEYALNDGTPIDIAALAEAHKFTGYAYSGANPQTAVAEGGGKTVIELSYKREHSVRYRFAGIVPGGENSGAATELPAALGGKLSGEAVSIDERRRDVEGYRWNGWKVVSPAKLAMEERGFVMPSADVVVEGSWSPRTDALAVNSIDDYYTGNAYALVVRGLLTGDAAYLTLGGERRRITGEAAFVNAMDEHGMVEVERDDAVIWRAELSIRIRPRKLTYAVESRVFVYDASPHCLAVKETTPNDWAGGFGIVRGQSIGVALGEKATRTFVTQSPIQVNGAEDVRISFGSNTLTENYEVTVTPGTMEVTRRPVTLLAPSGTFAYDAATHSLSAAEVKSPPEQGFLQDVSAVEIDFAAQGTGAPSNERRVPGQQNVTLDEATLRLTPAPGYEGIDLTRQYVLTAMPGTLSVHAAPEALKLHVEANDQRRVYDGSLQRVLPTDANAIRVTGLPDGVTLSGVGASAEGQYAGVYEAAVLGEPVLTDTTSVPAADVTACFALTRASGVFTIEKRPLRLLIGSQIVGYDGKAHTVNAAGDGVTAANGQLEGGLASGDLLVPALLNASRVEVGTSTIVYDREGTAIVNGELGVDATASYDIRLWGEGTLTITPADTSYAIHYTYDGTPDRNAAEIGFGSVGDVINAYSTKPREGMRVESVENFPLTLRYDPRQNIITVHYRTREKAPPSQAGSGAPLQTAETAE